MQQFTQKIIFRGRLEENFFPINHRFLWFIPLGGTSPRGYGLFSSRQHEVVKQNKRSTRKKRVKRTRMKVELLKPQTTFQLSTTATSFALYARETTRHARSALRTPRGLKLKRRARTHGALPRTRGTKERSERDSTHEDSKNIR